MTSVNRAYGRACSSIYIKMQIGEALINSIAIRAHPHAAGASKYRAKMRSSMTRPETAFAAGVTRHIFEMRGEHRVHRVQFAAHRRVCNRTLHVEQMRHAH